MQQKLPTQISPNPLLNSTVEVRFQSSLAPQDALNFYLDLFRTDLPKVVPNPISNQNLEYTGSFIFSNDEFSLYVSHNMIAFGNVGAYQLWSNYFPFIKNTLATLAQTGVVQKIERLSLRYVSFLEYKGEDLPIFNINVKFDIPTYERRNEFIKTEFFGEYFQILFQLARYVSLEREGRKQDGALIDIDVSCAQNLSETFNEDLFQVLNDLHSEEKKLFFALLHPEYLKSLNPIY